MMMVNLVTVVLGMIVFLLMLWWMTFPRNLPPGPRGLPILGYLPFLGKHPYLTLTELGKRYGPVFTVWLGPVPVIVLNSYDAIREAYIHRGADFMDRKCNFVQEHLFGCEVTKQGYFCHKLDQGLMDGLRIARHALGGAGIGRVPIEQQVREVLDNLIEEFVRHGKGKQAFNPRAKLSAACSSISCAILFSKRLKIGDKSLQEIEDGTEMIMESIKAPEGLFPLLRFRPGSPLPEAQRAVKTMKQIIMNIIKEHQDTIEPQNPRDFVDYYLQERAVGGKAKDDSMDLFQSCLDLLMASKDTLTAALCWLLFYLVNYPDWQQSLHQEITKVCGASGYTSYSERSRLPHVQAFISEVLRHASVVCVPPQHMLKVGATTLQGYDIPANAQVCANLWAVHHDESLWLNPHRFSPDRWLTPQGEYTECSTLIPFSIGQRLCVGSQLAEMVIFLFLTTLVQDFTFKPPEGVHDLPLDSTYRLARSPLPFDLIVECRKSN